MNSIQCLACCRRRGGRKKWKRNEREWRRMKWKWRRRKTRKEEYVVTHAFDIRLHAHTHAHVHAYIRTLWLPALLAANTHMHTGICMHTRIHTGMHAYMV